MFTQEGSFTAKVLDLIISDPPEWRENRGADDFDICIKLERADDPSQSDWWRGDMSQNYSTLKNKTHLKQCELTMEALHSVGVQGYDITTFHEQLVGKVIPITTKLGKANKEGKQYMNVYLGSFAPVALDAEEAKRRVAALFGGKADAAPAAAPAAAKPTFPRTPPPTNPSNPFGGGAKK